MLCHCCSVELRRLPLYNNINRIVKETYQEINIKLCYQNTTIKDSTRQFVKEILDLKASIEWRFTSAISKIEPDKNSKMYDWSYF